MHGIYELKERLCDELKKYGQKVVPTRILHYFFRFVLIFPDLVKKKSRLLFPFLFLLYLFEQLATNCLFEHHVRYLIVFFEHVQTNY